MSFLDFSDQNIERKFVESLLDAVGNEGTIFAHHASTEIKVLEKLKDKDSCKDLAEKIDNLIIRVKDTLNIVKNNFYAPAMNGDYDLKNIIKAIPSDISYEEKGNISDGKEAQLAWFVYTDPETPPDKRKKQIELLKEYCSKDTLALYYLIKYLIKNV
jgi:glucose-6-phosphate-specific signal transduction histidine kinase